MRGAGLPGGSAVGRVLQPATDLGVLVQFGLVLTLLLLASWWLRHRPEWRLVVLGLGMVLLGAMGVRAAH
ncbi:MAG: hypothetical protein R6V28_14845 [Nitriliruptoraceae bacterium]